MDKKKVKEKGVFFLETLDKSVIIHNIDAGIMHNLALIACYLEGIDNSLKELLESRK